jgi:phosphoglycerate dehydrogenase-like enzyme
VGFRGGLVVPAAFRVAVLDDYQHVAATFGAWAELGPDVETVFFHDHVDDPEQLVLRLRGFHAVVAMRERTPLPREVLSRLEGLELIVTAGMANAVIDVAAARELGMVVAGTGGWAGATATIELAWGLILATARRIPQEDAAVRSGSWQRGLGMNLAGKTLGIVGLGNLGPLMVPAARAFGMRVVGWSVNLTDERAREVGVERVERAELFGGSDVVTIHLKLGPRSVGYVTREDLRAMKPTAHLVNTSRGPVVDEEALLEALRHGWIAGAALDVFSVEPLPPEHPFRTQPNLVLSPHHGYVSADSYREFFAQFVEDVACFRTGQPVRVIETNTWR